MSHNLFLSLMIVFLLSLSTLADSWAVETSKTSSERIEPARSRYFNSQETSRLVAPEGNGTTYFVDGTHGNDSWDGKHPTHQGGLNGPFKTISKATDRYSDRMKGGNTIKIKAGLYRERVEIGNVTGNIDENSRFILGPYGDGEVVIDASDTQKLNWLPFPGNKLIYEAPCALSFNKSPAIPDAVMLDDDFRKCRPVYSLADVNGFGRWYYDKTANKIYIHTNGEDPASHDIIITKQDLDNIEYGIYAPGINYLTIYGLTIRGASAYGIYPTGTHVRIEECTVKFCGKGGVDTYGQYNELIKNHVWGTVLLNWPRGRTWNSSGGWPMGMVVKAAYSHIQGNIVHDNGGEGIGSAGEPGFNIIEDNISYDNWSVNIYISPQPDSVIRRNLMYCTGGDKSYAIDEDQVPSWTSLAKIIKRMRPEALMTADEETGGPSVSLRNHIYNNVMVGCAKGFTHYSKNVRSGMKDFIITNNTIILPDVENLGDIWVGIDIPYNFGNNTNTVIMNNIVYGTRSDQPLVWLKGGDKERGVTLNNNLYFSKNYATPFWSGLLLTTKSDLPKWQHTSTQDTKSLFADPQFKRVSNEPAKGDYHLLSGSPAIGKGSDSFIPEITDDFNMFTRKKDISTIGAFETEL